MWFFDERPIIVTLHFVVIVIIAFFFLFIHLFRFVVCHHPTGFALCYKKQEKPLSIIIDKCAASNHFSSYFFFSRLLSNIKCTPRIIETETKRNTLMIDSLTWHQMTKKFEFNLQTHPSNTNNHKIVDRIIAGFWTFLWTMMFSHLSGDHLAHR